MTADIDSPLAASGPCGSSSALLRVENLTVRYGLRTAVRDLSFEVHPGAALALLGVNGSGKSSLARAMSGLIPISSGRIIFDDRDITKWPPHRVRGAGLVYLPEERGIFPNLTVTENLRLATGVIKSRSDRAAAVERSLEIFPHLRARAKNHAAMLSGGEQQMLSLARALTTSPRLIIADELSLGLAPMMVDMVFDALELMKSDGAAIILIEQFAQRALKFAEQCVVLQRGELGWQGESRSATNEIVASYMGEGV